MKPFYVIAIVLCLLQLPEVRAQEYRLTEVIRNIVNEITEETGQENAELITEMLYDLASEPVIINSGDSAEISRLFFLTPFQVQVLASHVRRTGAVVSVLELASLTGFSNETVQMIMPFISMVIPSDTPGVTSRRGIYHRSVATAGIRYQDNRADPPVYPIRNSLRYRLRTGNLTASLTAASDAGEKPLWSARPDFISGGIAITGSRGISNVIAGDYSARFGMGLVVNSGYKPFITLTGSSYMGHRDGFTLSSSINENHYLRGIAVTTATGNFRFSAFTSSRYRDARTVSDTSGITGADILAAASAHSTLSALAATGVLREASTGFNLGFGKGNFRWAVTSCYTRFTREINEEGDSPGLLFSFKGNGSFSAGASYRMAKGRVTGAGELAISGSGALATAHTFNIRFDDRLTANLIYRNYGKSYWGHLSCGPGRNSVTGNEEGLMTRLIFEAAKGLFVYAGADLYRFPWLRQRASFPSHGYKAEVRARYDPGGFLMAELRIYGAETWGNQSGAQGLPAPAAERQTTSRLTVSVIPAEFTRITVNAFYKTAGTTGRGSMLAADLGYEPSLSRVSLWVRQAIFTTTGFDSGLYLYENDVLYGFSIPVHYGEGARTAAMAEISIGKNAGIKIKYGITARRTGKEVTLLEDARIQFTIDL
ncbi:MAG: hypothetical protein RBS37_05335 [Bacteroidales bacterium]|jgi:hypothetical protein|nr:hypothetical protein [Bacteroidales bacterium]